MTELDKSQLMRRATYASVITATLIISTKIYAWALTDSLSLLSSLVDSALDIAVSVINMAAVYYALRPADDDHRFGHGKAEDIAAMIQSAFITGSAFFICIEAIQRFMKPHEIENSITGIVVMLFSTFMTLLLLAYQNYVIRQTKSTVIQADRMHYLTDVGVNITVIISLGISMTSHMTWVDPFIALGIAAYILRGAFKVGKLAFDKLMDKEFDDEERQRIMDVILTAHPEVKGLHDLRTRYSGIKPFIQLHLELDGNISLCKAHAISDVVENKILEVYPEAEIIIHQDPDDQENIPLQRESVKAINLS